MNYLNDDFENSYKLSSDIGRYLGGYSCVINLFELIFGNDHLDKKRRIKYLSNIELDMLVAMVIEGIANRPSNTNKDNNKYKQIKNEILKFLR